MGQWEETLAGLVRHPFIIAAVITVVTPILGMWVYKRQKAIDECRLKYLTEGVDLLASGMARMIAASLNNWTRALFVVPRFRDLPEEDAALAHISLPFEVESFEPPGMGLEHLPRVEELLGMEKPPIMSALRKWYFVAMADHTAMRESVITDVAFVVREYPKNPAAFGRKKAELVQRGMEELHVHYKRCQRHQSLLGQLGELSGILWKAQITYRRLRRLPRKAEIRRIREAIEQGWKNVEEEDRKRRKALMDSLTSDSRNGRVLP